MSKLFVDHYHKIDRESLRVYVLGKLCQLKQEFEQVLFGDKGIKFLDELHNQISNQTEIDKEAAYLVERQMRSLPEFIGTWIQTAVDSEERMDFFVRAKAAEIGSGDLQRDYYWAMQIRHDQLVALVRVLELLVEHVRRFVDLKSDEVIDDGVFQGLIDYSVEAQVYLEAEKVAKERIAMAQGQ